MAATGDGVVVLGPGEGRQLQGEQFLLKAGVEATRGAYTLMAMRDLPPGLWIPPHVHQAEEEAWFVLDGELSFHVGERSVSAVAGSFLLVPRGLVHSFGNTGTRPASLLELFAPAGMEGYFAERTALAQAASPAGEPDFAGIDPEAHAAVARKYHMEFVWPARRISHVRHDRKEASMQRPRHRATPAPREDTRSIPMARRPRSACAALLRRGLSAMSLAPLAAALFLASDCGDGGKPAQPHAPASAAAATRVVAFASQIATQAAPITIPATAPATAPVTAARSTAVVPPAQASRQPAASSADSCRLVTQQEAESAAGKPLGPGQSRARGDLSRGGTAICQYSTADNKSWVEVDVTRGTAARTNYDDEMKSIGEGAVQKLPELGESAYFTSGLGYLSVLKGDVLISVQIVPGFTSDAEQRGRLMTLAQLALSRL